MTRDVDLLDQEVETFAKRRGLELDDATRMLIRDVMLWAAAASADDADQWAAGQAEDLSERRMTKAEIAAHDALTGFASIQRQWVDRTRAELGLPERDHKSLEDSIKAQLARKQSH